MIRTCPKCGQKNRVRSEDLTRQAICGKCKTPLPPIAEPIDADHAMFDAIVRHARVPVERVAAEMAGRALVLKVDTERHPEIAARYGVSGIPNFVVLRDGQVTFQQAGAVPFTEMKRWIDSAERRAS